MSSLKHICIVIIVAFVCVSCFATANVTNTKLPNNNQYTKTTRETILDKKITIHTKLVLKVPKVASWSDLLKLKKEYIDIGSSKLYVEEEGHGIPIVLINGGPGGTLESFLPYFNRAKHFGRLIYYDQRGCGRSGYNPEKGYTVDQAVNDLEKLRKALKIKQWVVLGWSYGGLLAQMYTIKYPKHAKGLVLVSAASGIPGLLGKQQVYLSKIERKQINLVTEKILNIAKKENWSYQRTISILIYNRNLNGDWKRQNFYKPTNDEIARDALYEWRQDTGPVSKSNDNIPAGETMSIDYDTNTATVE